MTSTGTYAFAPSAADVILNAYSMIQIRRTEMTTQHLQDAYMAANLVMVDLSNRNPLRWTMETQTQVLSATATYTLSARTIAIAMAYLSFTTEPNRVLGPISASEYAAVPNKSQTAPPTTYFFSLLTTPTITLWPVPDAASIAAGATLNMQTFRQLQDVQVDQGATLDAPYRFLDVVTTGVAARLAEMYRPERADSLDAKYEKRLTLAQGRDQESVPFFLTPALAGYFK